MRAQSRYVNTRGQSDGSYVKPYFALFAALAALQVQAESPDPAQGRKLVAEHRCETCHHNKTMGDAKAIYLRKDRKVTSMEKLKAQVSMCNTELKLQLFPEDEEHIAAYLNETYYKFK
jgi:cytochrome c2